MWKKKEEKVEEKEESLLKELCGNDAKLFDFLSYYMCERPLLAISKKNLDILIEEAEKSGDFIQAVDKAIFEATQTPGERQRYINVIQNLASKTIPTMKQQKEKAEKEGLTDLSTSLERRIEQHLFMSERTEDIIKVASQFYNEKLVEQGEHMTRKARGEERWEAGMEELRTVELEKTGREVRKQKRRAMGREQKKEADKQDKREDMAAREKKEAREEERKEAEREELRIGELEKAGREARKKERMEN